jgi:type III pantothenate kinase
METASKKVLMAIDIGNTNIDFGFFRDEVLIATEKIPTQNIRHLSRLSKGLRSSPIISAVGVACIASVRPQVEKFLFGWIRRTFGIKPLKMGVDFKAPVKIMLDEPETLANAVAAHARTKAVTVVVDFGSAVTFDVISRRGDFLGGAIAPGISLSLNTLYKHCALLPLVKAEVPEHAVGKTTIQAMHSGVFFGFIGMTQKILGMISDDLGCKPHVIATGGDGAMFANMIPEIDEVVPRLTLDGIRLSYEASIAHRHGGKK